MNCIDCGADRTDYDLPTGPHEPCRSCGSTRRNVAVSISVAFRLDGHVAYHANHPSKNYRKGSKSRPGLETWGGEQQSADGVYREVRRVVDREGNRYEETVTNPDGTLRRSESHKLSEHQGHGSAKKRP